MTTQNRDAFEASKENWTPDEWARAERYPFTVRWSDDYALCIAAAGELPYAMCHGRAPEEAVHNAVDAVASVIDAAMDNPAIVSSEPSGVAV